MIHSVQNALGTNTHGRIAFSAPMLFGRDAIASQPGFSFYSSHFAFDPQAYSVQPGDFYFTWIRHPYDLFVSGYYYYRKEGRPSELFYPLWVRESILEITSFPTIEKALDAAERGIIDLAFPLWYFDQLAEHHEKFNFIGICEHMERDIKRLGGLIGLPLQCERRNVGAQSQLHKSLSVFANAIDVFNADENDYI